MKRHFTKKIKVRFLISYLCTLLFPLFLLTIFIYNYIFKILEDEVSRNNLLVLQHSKAITEAKLNYMTSPENTIRWLKALCDISLTEDTCKAIDIQSELKNYILTNPYIYDIAYYQKNENYVITARSSSRKEFFFQEMYQFVDIDSAILDKKLEEEKNYFFIGEQGVLVNSLEKKDFIILVQPLTAGTNKKCLLYLIDKSFFLEAMPLAVDGGFMIIDENHNILVHSNSLLQTEAQINKITDSTEDYFKIKLDKTQYFVNKIYSDMYGWNYCYIIPMKLVSHKITNLEILMAGILFFILVIGVIGVCFIVKNNYTPIHKLELMTSEILKKSNYGNELDYVSEALQYLNTQNKKLFQEAEDGYVILKDQFIVKLLAGEFKTAEEVIEQEKKAKISLDSDLYKVWIIYLPVVTPRAETFVANFLLDYENKEISIIYKVQLERKRILIISGYPEGSDKKLQIFFTNLVTKLRETLKVGIIAGCGKETKVTEVSMSYLQASQALDYRIVAQGQLIITYDEVENRVKIPYKHQPEDLIHLIRNRKKEQMEQYLKQVCSEIYSVKTNISQIKRQCAGYIYAIERVIEDLNNEVFIDNPLYSDITKVLKYDTCEELFEIIRLIGCDIINSLESLMNKSQIDNILQYIAECYSLCDFSTKTIAENFNMSLSYLSQYFKQHTNQNILDYVTELRMNKAKSLLENTQYTTKEIAEKVGYYNVNSFNRRFKQIMGITPGEYRKSVS